MTQKNWVSKLQTTTKEQVSQAQVTQTGLGSRAQEGEVPGKKTISEASTQVAKHMAETLHRLGSRFSLQFPRELRLDL